MSPKSLNVWHHMLCHLHQSMITAMAAFETVYELRLLDQTTEYFVRAVHLARVIDIHSQSILLMNVLSFLVLAFMRIFVDCFLFHHMKPFPL